MENVAMATMGSRAGDVFVNAAALSRRRSASGCSSFLGGGTRDARYGMFGLPNAGGKSRLQIAAAAWPDAEGKSQDQRPMFWERNSVPGENAPVDTFRSAGTPSVPSRPSIPARYSKYTKHKRYSKPAIPFTYQRRLLHDATQVPQPDGKEQGLTFSEFLKHNPPGPPTRSSPFVADSSFNHWRSQHLIAQHNAARVRPPLPKSMEQPQTYNVNKLKPNWRLRRLNRRYGDPATRPSYELPFEFQWSYTEERRGDPLAFRGPQYSPFGPDSMPPPYIASSPPKKPSNNRREVDSFNPPPPGLRGVKAVDPAGPFREGQRPIVAMTREEILGEPLSPDEVQELIEAYKKEGRLPIRIGRQGLLHNLLNVIHGHWKRRRVVQLVCKGSPSIDMDNICFHLEDKTGGKVIHRAGGHVYLFRGRNYNPLFKPDIPNMLWKPPSPVYPTLIKQAPGDLTVEHAEYLRERGKQVRPLIRLQRKKAFVHLSKCVKEALQVDELVKIDCSELTKRDRPQVAIKLRDLLGVVILSIKSGQVLLWRGHGQPSEQDKAAEKFAQAPRVENGPLIRAAHELDVLWDQAITYGMVTTLEDNQLDPDTIRSIVGPPCPRKPPPKFDEEEEEQEQLEEDTRKKKTYEEYKLEKLLSTAPLKPAPVGFLPLDELAKLLKTPPAYCK